MQLRPDIALHASIKSLTEIVLPAVDPANKLAVEQLQLAIGLMAMMEQRLPLEFKFNCDELRRLLDFADELKPQAGMHPAAADFTAATAAGADVLRRAQASPEEVLDAVRRLRATGAALAASAYRDNTDPTQRAAIMKSVLTLSREQLLRDRAWVSPQGWEGPEALPPLQEML